MKINVIFFIIAPVLAAQNAADALPFAPGADEQGRYFTANVMPAKGVVLLAHGLNVRPAKMGDAETDGTLAKLFLDAGYHVYRVELQGHNGALAGMQNVKADDWLADALLQYRSAAHIAEDAELPLYLAAFSLGALVYENLMLTRDDVTFAAAVLFAPAIAIKPAARALLFTDIFLADTAIIDSRAPPEYRAQKGASLGAYKALFELEDSFHTVLNTRRGAKNAGIERHVPTLIFIDPEDEFISFPALKKQIAGLTDWNISAISNAGAAIKPARHHLIIDSGCVSPLTWQLMSEAALRFLKRQK
ncbi:MAG: alpha/beta hydrolase [Spirochaetaceae bacterium]|nr:alpha/beta hydrolase [Spirochaetaceae bacterium]